MSKKLVSLLVCIAISLGSVTAVVLNSALNTADEDTVTEDTLPPTKTDEEAQLDEPIDSDNALPQVPEEEQESNVENDQTNSSTNDDMSVDAGVSSQNPSSDTCTNSKGHLFSAWFETSPSTYLSGGQERSDCIHCDYFQERTTAPLDHSGFVATNGKGNKAYESLSQAISDVATDDTITLLEDVYVDKDDVTDLAGKYKTIFNIKGKRLTIDLNGNDIIANTEGLEDMLVGLIATENCGHLTLNDSVGDATVRLTANGANVYALLVNYDPSSTMTINGGNYILDAASDSLVYSGGNKCVTVNGGNFRLGNVGTGKNQSPWIFNVKGRNERHVTVNGGSFNWDIQHQYWPFEVDVPKEFALKKTIEDSSAVYEIVPAVAYVNEQEYSSKWYTNNTGYATLQEAIDAANTPAKATTKEYVTLLHDVVVHDTIVINKDLTIDLASKTIRGYGETNESFDLFSILADVTVKNGKIDASEIISCFAVGNDETAGKLTIDSGEYYGNISVAKVFNGELVINGGYFKSVAYNGDHRYTLDCDDEAYVNGKAKITVHAGKFYRFDPADNLAEGEGTNFAANGETNIEIDVGEPDEPITSITATKTPSLLASQTANVNELISYTITITNNGTVTTAVNAKDKLPTNVTYVSGADSVDGDELFWNEVILEKGQQVTFTYIVKVNSDTALYKDGIISAETAEINDTTASSYPIYIRRTLTENDAEYLKAALLALNDSSYKSNVLLKWIYYVAYSKGTTVTDTPENILASLFEVFDGSNDSLRATVAPTLYGGSDVPASLDAFFLGERAETVTEQSFNSGDVLLLTVESRSYIYLYYNGFIELTNGMKLSDTADVLKDIKHAEQYAVIRPSFDYKTLVLSQGMPDPETLTENQKILLLTAQSYMLRGERIQYDDTRLSSISKSEYRWMYGALAPEDYTADSWGYTNCAAFAYDLYYFGLGYDIGAYITANLITKTNYRIYFYQPTGKETSSKIASQTDKFFSTLQVGDIIVIRRDKNNDGSDDSGHALIYAGDGKAIHSSGSNFNYTNSAETYEPSIRYIDLRDYLFVDTSSNYLFNSTVSKIGILRPLNKFNSTAPENSVNRAENLNGIRAEKLSSAKGATSVNVGDEITFTFNIFNANGVSMPITITDILPNNTSLISIENGTCENGIISFNTTVGAYETLELSYTVKVLDTVSNGTKIYANDAKINGVIFKCSPVTVNRTLTEDEQAKIKEAIAYFIENNPDGIQGRALANLIYERAGFDAPFDSADSFTNIIYGILAKYNNSSTYVKVGTSGKYRNILVDGLYGGRYLFSAQTEYKDGGDRTRLPKAHDLVTGDVILARSGSTYYAFIYDGEYLYDISTTNVVKLDPNEALEKMMGYQNYFVVLRPSYAW